MRAITCDVLSVGGFVLAVAHQQGSVSGSLASSHAFWYGIMLAVGVALIFPGWVAILLFVVALLASGLLHSGGGGHIHSAALPYLIVAVIAVLVGLYFGRLRGLRHLGESDFRTRLRNIRGISRWF
jgi:hypothetical protein